MPWPTVVSAASTAVPKTIATPHAAPWRAETAAAAANTAAYVPHLSASTMDAPGSSESDPQLGPCPPNGSRQRPHTSAEIGERASNQRMGMGVACRSV